MQLFGEVWRAFLLVGGGLPYLADLIRYYTPYKETQFHRTFGLELSGKDHTILHFGIELYSGVKVFGLSPFLYFLRF